MKKWNQIWDYLYENCRDLPIYISGAAVLLSMLTIVITLIKKS